MQSFCTFLMFLGRLCIGAIFLFAGISKVLMYDYYSKYMASNENAVNLLSGHNEYIPFFLVLAAIIEIVCAISLILGWKVRWSATILFFFLIPVTFFFHDFWNLSGPARDLQLWMFLKNIAIEGGLLYIIGAGAGWGTAKE